MRARLTPVRVIVGIVIALAVVVVLLLRPAGNFPGGSGQYLLLPDIAHPVAPLVHVEGNSPPVDGGKLYFVDVREEEASELQVLFPWLRPSHSTLIPAAELLPPGSTDSAFQHAELRQMAESQRIAAAVALRRLGYHVVIHPDGVLVNEIELGTHAAGKLQPTDVITDLNGRPTPTISKLRAILAAMKPGQVATLRIRRAGNTLVERIRTINDDGRALVGFAPAQAAEIHLPIKVRINAGNIGGPSAGLAFTLEVMEQLGANVTHGYRIAATGEMNLNGTVSAIGGVEQKTWGVRDAGTQVFLVPVDGGNAKTAEKYAGPNLKIIPVRSIGQALHALATLPKLK